MKPTRHQFVTGFIVHPRMGRIVVGIALLLLLALSPVTQAHSPPVLPNLQGVTTQENDACATATLLATNGIAAEATLGRDQATTPQWFKLAVQQNNRYRLVVQGAGLQVALHEYCAGDAPAVALPNGQVEFTATRDGVLYLGVTHADLSAASTLAYQVTLAPAAPYRPSFTALAEVPQAVLRRATEFLEELRGSDLAPEWQNARVNPTARILYRPDRQEPAYYEFTVEKPVGAGYEPAGFIQLAAGEHDYPVTNWDVNGMSPTQEMAEIAPLGAVLTQFYRLDTLSYASEYEEPTALGITTVATDVVRLGELPNRFEGLDALPEAPFPLVTESIDANGNTTHEGPTELPLISESGWDSWAALKAGYKENYDPLLRSLKQRASRAWELDRNLKQYGESLIKGDVRVVYGLAEQTILSYTVTGDGAAPQYLQPEPLGSQETITGLQLSVLAEPADLQTRLPFTVELHYAGGASERIPYAIVNAAALRSGQLYLPLIINGSKENLVNGASEQTAAAPTDWGPWHYWWATGDAGALTYNQIPAHTRVNTSNCWSGCGATAWAMLFGWVDRRAGAGQAAWVNHWGIYRVNGGFGANVVAPLAQDAGVDNMTWEIRNQIGTYCCGTGGCTAVGNMIKAADYVRPRATASWRMTTKYDPTGLCWFGSCDPARVMARDQIVYRQAPALLATSTHYPMAYGYAERSKQSCFLWWCSTDVSRWFYVNQGWGGTGNDWIKWDDVEFSGVYNNP